MILMVMENKCSSIFLQSRYGVHITTVNGVEYDFNGHWECVISCSYRVIIMSILQLLIEQSMILMVMENMCS